MSHTGQAVLRCKLPELAERAKTMTAAQLARHYGVGHQAISRHLERAGITAQKFTRPVEELPGLAELAATLHLAALARHYGMTAKKMAHRLKLAGLVAAAKPNRLGGTKQEAIAKYADLADRAKEMHVSALARHYGVTPPTMTKTLRKRGLTAAAPPKYVPPLNARRAPPYKLVPHATPFTDRRVKSSADLAAEFLQKECAVYHCDDAGRPDPKGKFYRRGRAVLAPDEVVARAVAKGWNPRSWAEVAA